MRIKIKTKEAILNTEGIKIEGNKLLYQGTYWYIDKFEYNRELNVSYYNGIYERRMGTVCNHTWWDKCMIDSIIGE